MSRFSWRIIYCRLWSCSYPLGRSKSCYFNWATQRRAMKTSYGIAEVRLFEYCIEADNMNHAQKLPTCNALRNTNDVYVHESTSVFHRMFYWNWVRFSTVAYILQFIRLDSSNNNTAWRATDNEWELRPSEHCNESVASKSFGSGMYWERLMCNYSALSKCVCVFIAGKVQNESIILSVTKSLDLESWSVA